VNDLVLKIATGKITANARAACELCDRHGLEVWGVTKAVAGLPRVAEAMLAGGVAALAESRRESIVRMRSAGIDGPIYQIRSPGPGEAVTCVANTAGSFVADASVLPLLAAAAERLGRVHEVVLMADLETGREGLFPAQLPRACREAIRYDALSLRGLGVYFQYQGDAAFHTATLARLVALGRELEQECGQPLPLISGGSTSILRTQVLPGHATPGVNNVRLGTAILLGISSSVGPQPIAGFHQDTFVLEAELIEVKRSDRLIGLVAMGTIDAHPAHLFPENPGITVIDAASDHTLVDLTAADPAPRVGERLGFRLGYFGLNRAAISPFVHQQFVD
jgi:predicted amino acid racemase